MNAIATTRVARAASLVLLGSMLGFSLSRIGFTDFGELHKMFTLSDPRMILVFAGGVAISAVGLRASGWHKSFSERRIDRTTVAGGVLFGIGWAISGGCPGALMAQVGEGQAWALLSLVGALMGSRLQIWVASRFPGINPSGTCG